MQYSRDFSLIEEDVECSVLSALYFNDNERSLIFSKINVSHFLVPENRIIFCVLKEMHESNLEFNKISFEIKLKEFLNNTTDRNYLDVTENSVIQQLKKIYKIGYIDNIDNLIKIVINKNIKYNLDNFFKDISNENINYIDAPILFNEWNNKFSDIISNQSLDELEHFDTAIELMRHKIDEMQNREFAELTGITSGFDSIDKYTNGFQKGDLIILAARPGVGKTALSTNFILNAAESVRHDPKKIIVMFSLEMGKEQILQRMLSNFTNIDIHKLRSNHITKDDSKILNSGLDQLIQLPIYIDDNPNNTTMSIEAKLRQISKTKEISLVIIDYLQLISIDNSQKHTNRVNEVARISRHLKLMARQLDIPLIAIAQLSRKIEERKERDREPKLSDLRESGSIEQDADLVTFIDERIETEQISTNNYKKPQINKTKNQEPIMTFYIEKHRNGTTGRVDLKFQKRFGKFIDIENE